MQFWNCMLYIVFVFVLNVINTDYGTDISHMTYLLVILKRSNTEYVPLIASIEQFFLDFSDHHIENHAKNVWLILDRQKHVITSMLASTEVSFWIKNIQVS